MPGNVFIYSTGLSSFGFWIPRVLSCHGVAVYRGIVPVVVILLWDYNLKFGVVSGQQFTGGSPAVH